MKTTGERDAARDAEPAAMHRLDAFVEPAGYVPLTERVVAALPLPRWLTVAVFAIVPLVSLVTYWWTAAAGGPPVPPVDTFLPIRIVNVYLIVLSFVAAREATHRIQRVLAIEARPRRQAPRGSWLSWLLPPLVLAAVLSLSFVVGLIGRDAVGGPSAGLIVVTNFVAAMLINLPEMSAFWTGIVALAAVARLGREHLPGTFPEDRSLGLLPVGRLVLFVFLAYTAAFVPVFVVGTSSVPNFLTATAVFALGLAVIVLAVWRVHEAMAAERARQVRAARGAYAAAFREAAGAPGAGDLLGDAGASRLLAADVLLRGTESIHQWPFDDAMQRIAAVVMTGVITGLVVRVVLLALGL